MSWTPGPTVAFAVRHPNAAQPRQVDHHAVARGRVARVAVPARARHDRHIEAAGPLDDGRYVRGALDLHDGVGPDAVEARVVDQPPGVVAGGTRKVDPPANRRAKGARRVLVDRRSGEGVERQGDCQGARSALGQQFAAVEIHGGTLTGRLLWSEVQGAATSPSCPDCGAPARAGASRCRSCGSVFFEGPRRRSLPRPSPLLLGLLALGVAAAVAAVVLLSRDDPPAPPEPVASVRAEHRLETRLALDEYGTDTSVRCTAPVREALVTRCQVVYDNGDTQLLLVTLSDAGELDAGALPRAAPPGGLAMIRLCPRAQPAGRRVAASQ